MSDTTTKDIAETGQGAPGTVPWAIKGELVLNCNCTVFCPCVISLGQHPPTEGHCQTWGGVRIDEGHYGDIDLSGLNIGLMIEIPGMMGRGNWKVALFIDDRASDEAYDALLNIFSGKAKGTTGLFKVLVGEILGAERQPVTYETDGKARHITVGRKIEGVVHPVAGKDADSDLVVTNTQYWMGPDITVATASKGKLRAYGRVWDFDGRSAEICQIDWHGPR
ncbi:DUF1326 domain-containing protein [Primorskyibacter aestuariivivens]|uniref:DUF1326 domain-containing protein n=1 Tax=Primorskyibacter aestuariivivens TaxID=1888912 RepID=UPI0022FFC5B7|nr:DUF1326 domain-containing protein [Primorskyibacter aestuariivivens]MDA7429859.1 DUF1326 domain-containing protein [Primorskyibacter aestuariivivens]